MTAVVCAAYGFAYIQLGYGFAGDHQEIIDDAVGLYGEMSLPDEQNGDFVRADFYECFENMGLYWNIPSIHCFHSIVPSSIMEFYPEVGVKRDVSSKPEYSFYGLRALLSVKYLYADADETTPDTVICEGFNYHCTVNGYNIYENENYIPMGFTYEYYITEEEYYAVPEGQRDKVLVSAIVLNNSQILRYSSSLKHLEGGPDMYMSYDVFTRHAEDRANNSSLSFKVTSSGFTSNIFLSHKNLVFFSVPYDDGWTAYVNGVETAIERVDTGFMAVYADKGVNEIVFVYDTPGLKAGAVISAGALVIIAAYIVYFIIKDRRSRENLLIDEYYKKQAAAAESDEPELPPEEDMTVVRRPEDTPPYEKYTGPEEKIYPEL